MEAALKRACTIHGLSGIGANILNPALSEVTVYIHWEGVDGCASGSGKTFKDALAVAVAEMNERRARAA